MPMEFQDKVALVTGASSGIGRATALAFAREGAKLVIVARRPGPLGETAREIERIGAEVEQITADLRAEDGTRRVVKQATARFGGIDMLVNAAGVIGFGTIEDTTLDQWNSMIDINARAVFRLMQLCLKSLEARHGNIVNVSSVNGLRSFPGVLAYCVSKAAVDQLTRCAALELAPKGIRVNAVNPGVVQTNLHRSAGLTEEKYTAFLEQSKGTHPLGRVGNPEEIADLILFLASSRAKWITGATLAVDGGRHLTCAR